MARESPSTTAEEVYSPAAIGRDSLAIGSSAHDRLCSILVVEGNGGLAHDQVRADERQIRFLLAMVDEAQQQFRGSACHLAPGGADGCQRRMRVCRLGDVIDAYNRHIMWNRHAMLGEGLH